MDDIETLIARANAGDAEADLALTAQAAGGDIEVQRAILVSMIAGQPSFTQLARAELLARFVAIRGDVADAFRLASMLWLGALHLRADGDMEAAAQPAEEALMLFRTLSDAGDGNANVAIASMAPDFPDAWAKAQEMLAATLPDPEPGARLSDLLAAFADTRGDLVRSYLSDAVWALGYACECAWGAVRALLRKGDD